MTQAELVEVLSYVIDGIMCRTVADKRWPNDGGPPRRILGKGATLARRALGAGTQ
jgi:hypothetical protein